MALFWRRRRRRRRRQNSARGTFRHIMYGVLTILLVGGLLYGVWYVARLPAFTLSTINVTGGETVSHEAVRQNVSNTLEGTYTLFIPRRFSYFYPHDAVVAAVAAMPRVRTVTVERTNRKILQVTVEEYRADALWCTEAQTDCVFLSEDGYSFAHAPSLLGGVLLRHMFEDRSPAIGQDMLSAADMDRIRAFTNALTSELGFRTRYINHTSVGDEEYHLTGGGTFLVSPAHSAQGTFDNLRSILDSDEFAHIEPGNFNYIDLRFGNRVFVNEEMTPMAKEIATSTEENFGSENESTAASGVDAAE